MPWKIERSGDQFCVVTDPAGEKVKCHKTRDMALAHLRALYANVPDARPKSSAEPGELAKAWETQQRLIAETFTAQHPFGRAKVRLEPAGREFNVAVARTLEERVCGMVGRRWEDGDFDAMLFDFGEPTLAGFHMNGVVEQLYIAWFDVDGKVVDHMGMFTSDPCVYKAARPFRWALEMPAIDGGREGHVSPGSAGAITSDVWQWLTDQTLHIEE